MPTDFTIRFAGIDYEIRKSEDIAVITFAITRGSLGFTVPVGVSTKDADEADFIWRARANLHRISSDLAADTAEWAAPQPEAAGPAAAHIPGQPPI